MGELRSLAAPARPVRLGGIPFSPPSEGGCRGTECCPFFCSIYRPPTKRVGSETMAFFFKDFEGGWTPVWSLAPGGSKARYLRRSGGVSDCSHRCYGSVTH